MRVLALSTSTPRGSVALVRDGEAVATAGYVDLQGHAERVFAAIDAVLAQAGEGRGGVDAVACDVGPGSFTGVRVGVASAKGIAFGLGVPVVGVGSLEAMAAAAFAAGEAGPEDVVLAAIDAKKGEVFVAAYGAGGEVRLAPCARRVGAEAFAVEAGGGGRVVVVGEVVEVGVGDGALPAGVRWARGAALDLPAAGWVGRLAAARVGRGRARGDDEVEPVYVRAPDATPARSE